MQIGINIELPASRYRSGFGGAPAAAVGGGDVTPPGTIGDFQFIDSNTIDDVLFATDNMPGDDGYTGPTAPAFYEIRRAVSVINTEGKWAAAEQVSAGWQPQTFPFDMYAEFYLVGLSPGTHNYHVRLKDAAGNVSGISNGVNVTLTG